MWFEPTSLPVQKQFPVSWRLPCRTEQATSSDLLATPREVQKRLEGALESLLETKSPERHPLDTVNLLNFSRFGALEMWISEVRIYFESDAQNTGQQADRRAKSKLGRVLTTTILAWLWKVSSRATFCASKWDLHITLCG